MIFRAIKFVADAHEGHYRKGTNIPYISHLTNVMKILCENGCSQEVIVAGILHDAVEDTPVSLDVIKLKFGDRVAELVAAASEKEKLETGDQEEAGWKERKQHTIDSLQKTDSVDKLLVSCADKLDNTRAILQDYRKLGDQLWTRFNTGKEEQRWYYQSLAEVFVKRGNEFGQPLKNMANEMKSTVDLIFENN